MTVDEEVARLHSKGINIDNDLYMAFEMSIIANEHLIVSSSNPELTAIETKFIAGTIWGIQNIIYLALSHSPKLDTLEKYFKSAQGKNSIIIMIGLENVSHNVQSKILKLIKSVNPATFFTLISIIKYRDNNTKPLNSINKYLQSEFWMLQKHTPIPSLSFKCKMNPATSTRTSRIESIRNKSADVKLIRDIHAYIYDIIVFARVHRMVVGGIPTFLLKKIESFVRIYAVLNGYDFVIPQMVKIAAMKLLPLHIKLLKDAENEPTLLYGSDINVIKQVIDKWNEELVVEDILNKVQPPV